MKKDYKGIKQNPYSFLTKRTIFAFRLREAQNPSTVCTISIAYQLPDRDRFNSCEQISRTSAQNRQLTTNQRAGSTTAIDQGVTASNVKHSDGSILCLPLLISALYTTMKRLWVFCCFEFDFDCFPSESEISSMKASTIELD